MPDPTRRPDPTQPTVGLTDWSAVDALPPAEVEAAAVADPDAPPKPEAATLHPMAPVKRLRLRLGLGPQSFAARYHIPLEQLLAWERHREAPDPIATAYLTAIAADPDGIAAALVARPAAE